MCSQVRQSRGTKCQEERCSREEKELHQETTECLHVVHERDEAQSDSRVHIEGIISHKPDSGPKGQWSSAGVLFEIWPRLCALGNAAFFSFSRLKLFYTFVSVLYLFGGCGKGFDHDYCLGHERHCLNH